MMAFYKENKVNPFGSCIPLLVQAPVFIALYFVLKDLDQDVKAGDDLSFLGSVVPDITASLQDLPTASLIVMMIVYVGSQMASTLLMPTSLDKTQRYIFLALPLIFAVVIVNQSFPAGLLIYWITTNLWTVGQALVIRTFFPPPMLASQKAAAAAAKKGKEPPPPPKAKPVKPKPKPDDPDTNGATPTDEEAPTAGTGASASKKRKGDRVRQRNVRRPAKPDRPRGQPGSQPGGSGADS